MAGVLAAQNLPPTAAKTSPGPSGKFEDESPADLIGFTEAISKDIFPPAAACQSLEETGVPETAGPGSH
jgi:hypothetical protein